MLELLAGTVAEHTEVIPQVVSVRILTEEARLSLHAIRAARGDGEAYSGQRPVTNSRTHQ